MIEESLRKHLEEKEEIQVELEKEIVSLKGNYRNKTSSIILTREQKC